MEQEAEASPQELANAYYQEATNFLSQRLAEAITAGHLPSEAASDIFSTFCRHFATIVRIAGAGRFPSDTANAAQSALTIAIAAFTAGSRDPTYLARVAKAAGVGRAATARAGKAKNSASQQLSEAITEFAFSQKKLNEDLARRADRMAIAARIKPRVDEKVAEFLRQGFNSTATLSIEAIEKRLKRRTAIKPSDS